MNASGTETLRGVLSALDSGETTSTELTDRCLKAAETDRALNNFICLSEFAVSEAARADALRKKGIRLPLLGVPFAVKDNIDVAGLATTCASKCLLGNVPVSDAEIIAKLRSDGAVVIGKTNMDEFAMGSTDEYPAFGPVKNAHDCRRVPGGSSGGSANSVAAGQVAFALGSDTGGSVRQPAAYCGVVGLKPTFDRAGRRGLNGLSPSLDTYGIFARNCVDAAIVFGVVYGVACSVSDSGMHGLKVGIADEFIDADVQPGVKRMFFAAADALTAAGAETVRVRLPSLVAALPAYHIISSAEAARTFSRKYEHLDPNVLGEEVKRRLILGKTVVTGVNYDNLYIKAAKVRAVVRAQFDDALNKCDVLISPTCPSVATFIGAERDPNKTHGNDVFAAPVSLAGLPAVSVPFGSSDGMPVGIQIIGKARTEAILLGVGHVLMNSAL